MNYQAPGNYDAELHNSVLQIPWLFYHSVYEAILNMFMCFINKCLKVTWAVD